MFSLLPAAFGNQSQTEKTACFSRSTEYEIWSSPRAELV